MKAPKFRPVTRSSLNSVLFRASILFRWGYGAGFRNGRKFEQAQRGRFQTRVMEAVSARTRHIEKREQNWHTIIRLQHDELIFLRNEVFRLTGKPPTPAVLKP